MFDHFVVSVLVAPLLTLIGTWWLADRIRPDLAARVIAWSSVVVATASFVNLLAFAFKALAETRQVASIGNWSSAIVRADTEHVAWVSAVALAWASLATLAAADGYRRYRRALSTAWSTVDGLTVDEPTLDGLAGDGEVVVVPDERVDAFALPGRRGQNGRVVVTSGMRAAVDSHLYGAIVAHEHAHLAGRHHQLVWLARLAGLLQPILWPVIKKVEYLVERAADEAAARSVGDRDDMARAIAHAALAALGTDGTSRRRVGPLAMSSQPSVVPRRMAAMTSPAKARGWLLALPLLLAAFTVAWTGECAYDLHELLALAGSGGA
ncbi:MULTISPECIES: M48 family metalloprotease [unclassified Pseudofrankia]|uniref:M48 family metalloprotease n=1 Tax=unclassified Pseudofrankia TaxID=2994372 RepID=UPI0008D91D9A|nr:MULTISPECIES: M48 family metalloprotease [unclassified Pseudofrankia]MDT3439360.1 M48 family metalloprotease [Pseudofrankia sp. BMG5.37]OHV65049.1 hypothetical protein BCD48_36885 [Pseudofrankia sp. BMG5.36]